MEEKLAPGPNTSICAHDLIQLLVKAINLHNKYSHTAATAGESNKSAKDKAVR